MGNSVEVVFEVKDNGVLRTGREIADTYSRMAPEVARAWRAVEEAGDRAGKAAEGGLRQAKRAAKEYADAALDAKIRSEELAKAQERLSTLPGFTNRQLPVDLSARGFRGSPVQTGGTGLNVGAITDADAFKFREQQVAFERQKRLVTQTYADIERGATKATEASRKLNAVSLELRNSIKEGLGRGSIYADIIDVGGEAGGGGKFGLAVAAIAAGAAIFHKVSSDIRTDFEKLLELQTRLGVVSRGGLQGGVSQSKSELEQLRQLQSDVRKLISDGDQAGAQALIDSNPLTKGLNAATLESRFKQSLERAKRLGVDTTDPAIIEQQKRQEEIRLKGISDANELNRIKLEGSNREYEAQQRSIQLTKESVREIANLRSQLTDNPLARIYDAAEQRQRQFLERFKDVPQTIKAEFLKLNDDLKRLDVFKQSLASQDRLQSLLAEQDRLRAGVGRPGQRFSEFGAPITDDEARARVERNILARQIASDQAAITRAGLDPLKQQLALDRFLQHTSDIGKLTEDQINLRTDALRRRIEIENATQEQKDAKEAERLATDKAMIPALKEFTVALLRGIGLNVNIKDAPDTRSEVTGSEPSPFNSGAISDFAKGFSNSF